MYRVEITRGANDPKWTKKMKILLWASPTHFFLLPTIITGPGRYITRCGEVVTIDFVVPMKCFYSAHGNYANGVKERWDRTGRLLPSTLSDNDVVGVAE